MLKDCLSALCRGSTKLLADPQRDQLTYALDPLQVPQFMVGPVLVAWLMSKSGNVSPALVDHYLSSLTTAILHFTQENIQLPSRFNKFSPSTTQLTQTTVSPGTFTRPHQPAKRGRLKKIVAPPPPEPEAQLASPAPSLSHSGVSPTSPLALSQAQTLPPSASFPPMPTWSTRELVPPPSSGAESEPPSPSKTLARLLVSSSG
ncbi:hypothetical protein RSOLAG1IB_11895 [Rhizoctonia solani AG-1 IB]|uniref:Uncharacterized protein n=1 Tax=Thanatephorus cucumeris (strain AG1-IB / isolate 7/3/14) TaxID=1108050 RepID=M5C4J0_THACB|nr:hypothetical protein BN14_08987 [Rhizoctonia solani AG-1 IB]CEL56324.1 hypothetical protein RSOLAG1IB_11895 [Rhizoctonia solani AG-1 IB]